MGQLPLTIILPNYNHAHWIASAVESVLKQSFSDFELLIVDDGSKDHSLDIIESYVKCDSRIKCLRHKQNLGIAKAFQTAFEQAKGEYFHPFSMTDCYLPGFLEKQMSLLLRNREIGISCCDTGLFEDIPGDYLRYQLLQGCEGHFLFPPNQIHQVMKYERFVIPGLCAILKKESWIRHGGYLPKLHFMCDGVLNQRIALFEGALYIAETLIVFREPEYSKKSSLNPQKRKEALDTLLEMILDSKNRELLKKMKQSAYLGILGKERIWAIIKKPILWSLYWGLAQRVLYEKWKKLKKSSLSVSKFLKHQI